MPDTSALRSTNRRSKLDLPRVRQAFTAAAKHANLHGVRTWFGATGELASPLPPVQASARITPDTSAHTPFEDGSQLGSKLVSGSLGEAGEKAPNGEKNLFRDEV